MDGKFLATSPSSRLLPAIVCMCMKMSKKPSNVCLCLWIPHLQVLSGMQFSMPFFWGHVWNSPPLRLSYFYFFLKKKKINFKIFLTSFSFISHQSYFTITKKKKKNSSPNMRGGKFQTGPELHVHEIRHRLINGFAVEFLFKQ